MADGADMADIVGIDDKGPYILGVVIGLTTLCTLFTAGRLFVRGHLQRQLLLDDYIIVVSVVCAWLLVVFTVLNVGAGSGRHVDTLTPAQQGEVLHWTVFGFTPGILSFALPKLAVVALLTRIMRPSKTHRMILWAMVILCVAQLLVCIATLFLMCDPDNASATVCVRRRTKIKMDMYIGSFSAFVDLYLAIYPAIVLFQLQLSLLKKTGLSIALGIGLVSTVVAAYKCTRLPTLASPDFTFDSADLVVWTSIEGNTIIIAACIPIMKPLYDYVRNGFELPPSSGLYRSYPSGGMSSGRANNSNQRKAGKGGVHVHALPSYVSKGGVSKHEHESQVGISTPPSPVASCAATTEQEQASPEQEQTSPERPTIQRTQCERPRQMSLPSNSNPPDDVTMQPRLARSASRVRPARPARMPARTASTKSHIVVTDDVIVTFEEGDRSDLKK